MRAVPGCPGIAEGSCRAAVGHPVNLNVADAALADVLLLPMPRPPAWSCTWSGLHSARSRH